MTVSIQDVGMPDTGCPVLPKQGPAPASPTAALAKALAAMVRSSTTRAEAVQKIGVLLLRAGARGYVHWQQTDNQQLTTTCNLDSKGVPLHGFLLSKLAQLSQTALERGSLVHSTFASRFHYEIIAVPIFRDNQATVISVYYESEEKTIQEDFQESELPSSNLLDVSLAAAHLGAFEDVIAAHQSAQSATEAHSTQAILLPHFFQALQATSPNAAASELCRAMQAALHTKSNTLASVEHATSHVQIVGQTNMPLGEDIPAFNALVIEVLREAVLLDQPLRFPTASDDEMTADSLQRLSAEMSDAVIVSVPLKDASGKTVAAWLGVPDSAEELTSVWWQRVAQISGAIAASFATIQRIHESKTNKFWHRLLKQARHKKLKTAFIILGVLVVIGLIPWPHRLKCHVICEPFTRRFVAAPFDGTLLETLVAPGDQVQADQVLALMDGSELRSNLASLRAKLDQAEQRRAAALNSRDASNALTEQKEIRHLQMEIDILEKRVQGLDIRSPLEGVIVSGDLERSEGIPLTTGAQLFEVAPLDHMVAEIAIPEDQIQHAAAGLPVTIALNAFPGHAQQAALQRIHPRAEIRDNQSVFVAEVEIDNQTLQLRPGMSGTARVKAGWRPLGWILLHRPWNAFRKTMGW